MTRVKRLPWRESLRRRGAMARDERLAMRVAWCVAFALGVLCGMLV